MNQLKRKVSIALIALLCVVTTLAYKPSEVSALALKTVYFYDNTPQSWVSNDSASMELATFNGELEYTMVKQSDRIWRVDVPVYYNDFTFNRYSADGKVLWNTWNTNYAGDKTVYEVDSATNGYWSDRKIAKGFQAGDAVYLDLSHFQDWTKDNAKIFIQVYGDNINELYEVTSSTPNQLYAFTFDQSQSGAKLVRFWRGQAVNYVWNSSIDLTYDDFVSGTNCVSVSGWNDQGSLITK